MKNSESIKWLVLFASFLSMFSFVFSMQSFPPILPYIVDEFGVGYGSASSLMWLVALPGIFLSILGGILSGRYGIKMLCLLGLSIVAGSSMLCAISNSYLLLQLGRLALGVGGALVVVSAPVPIFQWFDRKELGLAMGLFGLTMPVATVLSFNVLSRVASIYSWRTPIFFATAVNASILLICFFAIKEKDRYAPGRAALRSLKNSNIWILGLIWGFFNMGVIGYTTWGKTIFTEFMGLPLTFSDFLASLLMLVALITPLGGFVSDRAERRRPFIQLSSLLMLGIFLVFPFSNQASYLLLASILGLSASFLAPAVFALPEEILGVGKGGLGFAVLNTCLNIGVALGPMFVGYALDLTRNSVLAFLTMAVFMFVTFILALVVKSR